jgi:HEAT repeat protein
MREILAWGMLGLILLAGRALGAEPKSVKDHETDLLAQLKAAKNAMDRVRVLRLLPGYGAEAAVPAVVPLLDEQDELIRAEAVDPSVLAAIQMRLDTS